MPISLRFMFSFVCTFMIMALLASEVIAAGNPFDESLTVIREFLLDNRGAIEQDVDRLTERVEDALRWLRQLQNTTQMDPGNEQVWTCHVPTLWNAIQSLNNDCESKPSLDEQEKLLKAFLSFYFHPDGKFADAFVEYVVFGFDRQLICKYGDELMKPFMGAGELTRRQMNVMIDIMVPKYLARRYPEWLQKQIVANRSRLDALKAANAPQDRLLLRFNAYYGEPEAEREKISSFLACPAELATFDELLSDMFIIDTHDSLVAVLSRFHEETGAPDFDVSGCKIGSPRYDMLRGFRRKYPGEPFFIKYREYLRDEGVGMDEEIGGEEGVKKMFEEFRNWAKEKFNYEIDLSNVSYHVNLCRLR